ncbi:hypothetical protein AAVH_08530 [Aphelenchoides avenae]|nr:hypothetical protein AAVH_08530 [Aphelenchus avenae]
MTVPVADGHIDPCGTAVDNRHARDGDWPPDGLRLLSANFTQLRKCLVVKDTSPGNERHGDLPMRQHSGHTLQAPAASEDFHRPSSSRHSLTAHSPSSPRHPS